MSPELYLVVMVSVVTVITAISVPVLFLEKCPACARRNLLDAKRCRGCGAALPGDGPPERDE